MSEPFLAEIRIFAGAFAPRGWAFCNGQVLPIAQNSALFSLVGTTYGGDGTKTFGLPDLQGRAPMHPGSGPGLTPRTLGEQGGADAVALSDAQMPTHAHQLSGTNAAGPGQCSGDPANALTGQPDHSAAIYGAPNQLIDMVPSAVVGAAAAHQNLQPSLALNFIIALDGIFPPRE